MKQEKQLIEPEEADIAWFAGFFDGEGWIDIAPYGGKNAGIVCRLRIGVGNSHLPTLQRILEIWKVGTIYQTTPQPSHLLFWLWRCAATEAGFVLEAAYPHLITKHAEAEIAIAFQQLKDKNKRSRSHSLRLKEQLFYMQLQASKTQLKISGLEISNN